MADIKLFEIGASTTPPDNDYRIALGKAGVPAINTDLTDFIAFIQSQIAINSTIEEVIEIGAWNMDTTGTKNVAWSLPADHYIIGVDVLILYNGGALTQTEPLNYVHGLSLSSEVSGGWRYSGGNFALERLTGGHFDQAAFNDAVQNRGFVTVRYRPIPN